MKVGISLAGTDTIFVGGRHSTDDSRYFFFVENRDILGVNWNMATNTPNCPC